MKKINKKLTPYNRDVVSNRKIKYIVIHWVGAVSSAKNNAMYFYNGYRGASAHYFVDDTSIWQSVLDKNIAWAVGSSGLLDQGSVYAKYGAKYFGTCTNSNSISIEMCCVKKNGVITISDATIKNTAELVQYLMKEHDIDADHVIRHFDVNGKICPGTHIREADWKNLHKTLTGKKTTTKVKTNFSKKAYTGVYPEIPSVGYFQRGSYGKQVKYLQMYLNWCINAKLKVDGQYGPATITAVKKFQEKYGLTVDGLFGKSSLTKAKTIKK